MSLGRPLDFCLPQCPWKSGRPMRVVLANCGPWATSSLPPVFVNNILLEHSCASSFMDDQVTNTHYLSLGRKKAACFLRRGVRRPLKESDRMRSCGSTFLPPHKHAALNVTSEDKRAVLSASSSAVCRCLPAILLRCHSSDYSLIQRIFAQGFPSKAMEL